MSLPQLQKIYCQACGRLCNAAEVEIFMDFKICDSSDSCRERIRNLPMMFVDNPFDESLQIDPKYIGKLIRRGFTGSKYAISKVSILNTAHYRLKSSSLVTIEFLKDDLLLPTSNLEFVTKTCDHKIREASFPEGVLQFENSLKELDPKSLNGESRVTKIRMKRTLKRLRRVYRQLVLIGS